ncbi:MAG TPA: condensation domain-containing protein [Caulobacteraceae bacterium]|jgi:hypothetical protein|nr:condensation domain-containing protein [Caulobacteraceae bacterium]
MSVAWLLASLTGRGIELRVEAGELRYRGPPGALTDEDKTALRARKAELVAYLDARAAAPRPMDPPPTPGILVASATQRVWWTLVRGLPEQLRMERVPFVLPLVNATPDQAEAAIRALVARHHTLRTRFAATADGPVPRLNDAGDLAVTVEAVQDAGRLTPRLMAFVGEPLPVDGGWLVRAGVFPVAGGPTVIALVFHHIVFDGTSLGLIAEDLKRSLSGLALDDASVQFVDYAAWERGWFDSGAARPLTDYWRDWLARTPRLAAPGGGDLRWRPGARIDHPLNLPADLSGRIAATAAALKTTPFIVILSVFAAALAAWSGQERFALRAIGDLRATQALARTVGLLICADALEAEVPAGGDFAALAARMAAEYDGAVALRLPTHPAATGAGYTEFHEEIGATINYVPAWAMRSVEPREGETEAAREAPQPGPVNQPQRLDWPVHLPTIFLRLWEAEGGLTGRLECNEALLSDEEQAGLAEEILAAFANIIPLPGGERAGLMRGMGG